MVRREAFGRAGKVVIGTILFASGIAMAMGLDGERMALDVLIATECR